MFVALCLLAQSKHILRINLGNFYIKVVLQMKDEILERVTMQEVLEKYGIETRRAMFKCPFHR